LFAENEMSPLGGIELPLGGASMLTRKGSAVAASSVPVVPVPGSCALAGAACASAGRTSTPHSQRTLGQILITQ
jgi:hypothetical protein